MMKFLEFLKQSITDSRAWMGFYLGANVFFLLGIFWNTFSLETRWTLAGINAFLVLVSIFIVQKPRLQKTDKYKC